VLQCQEVFLTFWGSVVDNTIFVGDCILYYCNGHETRC
jgi:hypothetical protein